MEKPCFIIAEAGVNHNGDLGLARKLIFAAAAAGADAVKFQSFRASDLASQSAPKAGYQLETTSQSESQFEMLKRLELTEKMHFELIEECKKQNIEFMSSTFGESDLLFLTRTLKQKTIKIPSGEITNGPLLLKVARENVDIILSTGMCFLGEVEEALKLLAFGYLNSKDIPSKTNMNEAYLSQAGQTHLKNRVKLLHCTTEYPAPFDQVNLRVMETFRNCFGLVVGFSDHTPGISIPIAAVALGAKVIEKHFTLDRNLPGPDHKASLEPLELKQMIKSIREVEVALGGTVKAPVPAEFEYRKLVRKSLVTKTSIKKGENFSEQSLTSKRPGEGISPMQYWDILGTSSDRDYDPDQQI